MAHTLKYLHRPCNLHTVRYNMGNHSEFLITSGALMDFYCDLGSCIIQTKEPFLVAKIHGFRTQVNDARLQKKNEDERCRWLLGRISAYTSARDAAARGETVQEDCESQGVHYDECDDEPRLIAKVPGLNIYLELLGCMGEKQDDAEANCFQRLSSRLDQTCEHDGSRCSDNSSLFTLHSSLLSRMAVFYRSVLTKGDAQTYATQETDWQPREDWQEMYDPNEYFRRPDRHGIGFDR